MRVWFLGRTMYLVGRTNEWVANPPGPGQLFALQNIIQIKFKCVYPGKLYTREGSASFEKLEKLVWRPKGTSSEVCCLL